ncbi:unnamed protein product [Bemisia tabaci]|uniref:RNase NYN domain-containing protein n=1 Tax=Bemisia tabaci TaxID=7038 RepID=A0A9N9ZX39_BEMTA|nr:unnamed protein product [Bemisia tabaci]
MNRHQIRKRSRNKNPKSTFEQDYSDVSPEVITLDSRQKRKLREPCPVIDLEDEDISIVSTNLTHSTPSLQSHVSIHNKIKKKKQKFVEEVCVIENELHIEPPKKQTHVINIEEKGKFSTKDKTNLIAPESITAISSPVSSLNSEKSIDFESPSSVLFPVASSSKTPAPNETVIEPLMCTPLSVSKTSPQSFILDQTPSNFMPYKRSFQLPNLEEIHCIEEKEKEKVAEEIHCIEEKEKVALSQSVNKRVKRRACRYALRSCGPPLLCDIQTNIAASRKELNRKRSRKSSQKNIRNSKLSKIEGPISQCSDRSKQLSRRSAMEASRELNNSSSHDEGSSNSLKSQSHEIQELDFIPIAPTPKEVEEDLRKFFRQNKRRKTRKLPLRCLSKDSVSTTLTSVYSLEMELRKQKRQASKERKKECKKALVREKLKKQKVKNKNLQGNVRQMTALMKKIKSNIHHRLKLLLDENLPFRSGLKKFQLKYLRDLTSIRDDDYVAMLEGINKCESLFTKTGMFHEITDWASKLYNMLNSIMNKKNRKLPAHFKLKQKLSLSKSKMEKLKPTTRTQVAQDESRKSKKLNSWTDEKPKIHQMRDKQAFKCRSRINEKACSSKKEPYPANSTPNENARSRDSSPDPSESLNDFNWLTLDAWRTDYEDISSDEMPASKPEIVPQIPENVPVAESSSTEDQLHRPRSESESSCQEVPVEPNSKIIEVVSLDEVEERDTHLSTSPVSEQTLTNEIEMEVIDQTLIHDAMSSALVRSKEASMLRTRPRPDDDQLSVSSEDSFSVDIGTNIFVPGGVSFKGRRPIIIDGSNVAIAHGISKRGIRVFSSKGLEICAKFFTKRGHKVIIFVPLFRRSDHRTLHPEILNKLSDRGLITYTPSRRVNQKLSVPYDDRYIVQCAVALGGVIVSTDNFRDLLQENPTWRSTIEKRLLMFTFVGDMLIFPQDPLGRRGPKLDEFLMFPR